MKKNKEACGEFEGLILPSRRFSSRKSSVAFCSLGVSGNTFPTFGVKESSRFISWSHALEGGNQCASSSENTEVYSLYFSGRFVSICVLAFANSVAMVVFCMLGINSFPFLLNLFWTGRSCSPQSILTKVSSGYSGFSLSYSFGRNLWYVGFV